MIAIACTLALMLVAQQAQAQGGWALTGVTGTAKVAEHPTARIYGSRWGIKSSKRCYRQHCGMQH